MSIGVTCPRCGKSARAPDDAVGKKVRCQGCRGLFIVEAPWPSRSGPPGVGQRPTVTARHAFPCPNCGSELEVNRQLIGQIITCRECEQQIKVPPPKPSTLPTGVGGREPPPSRLLTPAARPQPATGRPTSRSRMVWLLSGTFAALACGAVVLLIARRPGDALSVSAPPDGKPAPFAQPGSGSTPAGGTNSPSTTSASLPGANGPRLAHLAEPDSGIDIQSVYVDTSIPFGKPPPDPLPVCFPSGTKRLNLIIVLKSRPFGEMVAGYRILSNTGTLNTQPKADESGYAASSMSIQSPLLALILFADAPGGSFPDGPYRAVVQINGKDCFELNWSVGGAPREPGAR